MLTTAVVILLSGYAMAQSLDRYVIGAGGSHTNNQLQWTLGEFSVENNLVNGYELNEGFHQGKLIISSLAPTRIMDIKVYPNPTTSMVFISDNSSKKISYEISNNAGQMIKWGNYEPIDFSIYPNGIYFIKVFVEDQFVQTFKILKKD